MPINIPNALPATSVLTLENVFVMTKERAMHQDIRPLELLFLNLMPQKITTEIQYMRKLSNTPLQVNIELLRIDEHESKNTPEEHLNAFYKNFSDIKSRYYDGMIVTGAPLDKLDFSDVTYFSKLREILNWADSHVTSTLYSCWGVAAALQVFYDIPIKHRIDKLSGVFKHRRIFTGDPLLRGFDDEFLAPHSRFMDIDVDDIIQKTDLRVLAYGDEVGVFLASSSDMKKVFVTGHPEYDANTLKLEYERDLSRGLNPKIPINYFKDDDVNNEPMCLWRSHASMLFANWLNYYVYQVTPYDLDR